LLLREVSKASVGVSLYDFHRAHTNYGKRLKAKAL
jgi:hypothetical protein